MFLAEGLLRLLNDGSSFLGPLLAPELSEVFDALEYFVDIRDRGPCWTARRPRA